MSDYWFKPKTHGYGAYPIHWKGWAVIAAFAVGLLVIMWPWVIAPALSNIPPTVAGIVGTLIAAAVATLGFLKLVKAKTDGDWAWRWGQKNKE